MLLIDTHAHLNFQPICKHVDDVLTRAYRRGVHRILLPSYDSASWESVAALAGHRSVFPAFGLHPWKAEESLDVDTLKNYLTKYQAVAIGEIGLDFHVEVFDKPRQIDVFTRQLDMAVSLDLPVMLHCRGAFMEMLDILDAFGGNVRGVIHAFSRGPDMADAFLKRGVYIGFGGAITRENARRARHSAVHVPLEKIVLETDCPSIGLEGVLPEQVEPMHVADVAAALATLRDTDVDDIAKVTTANAVSLFGALIS
ncbi:MAG: TatD family hydrolase [Deltaproteobacteria bacterium]|nr:TatD family hydrolase [Deltaproteobacteria bacterium]MBN2672506.1 TatD family hydrolase [Deltaproteobacteria bacterium]